ncbi:hypothetical protein D9M72_544050 [compost metagenome]
MSNGTSSTLAIGSLPLPSDVEIKGGVSNSPIGSTIQYQPVCGCEKRRSPSCGLPERTVFSLTEIELTTLKSCARKRSLKPRSEPCR